MITLTDNRGKQVVDVSVGHTTLVEDSDMMTMIKLIRVRVGTTHQPCFVVSLVLVSGGGTDIYITTLLQSTVVLYTRVPELVPRQCRQLPLLMSSITSLSKARSTFLQASSLMDSSLPVPMAPPSSTCLQCLYFTRLLISTSQHYRPL